MLMNGLPRWHSGKEFACKAGDIRDAGDTGDPWVGEIPGSGGSPEVGNGNSLQYFCLENYMDRGAMGYSPWGCKELDTTGHTCRVNSYELCEKWSGNFTEKETEAQKLRFPLCNIICWCKNQNQKLGSLDSAQQSFHYI